MAKKRAAKPAKTRARKPTVAKAIKAAVESGSLGLRVLGDTVTGPLTEPIPENTPSPKGLTKKVFVQKAETRTYSDGVRAVIFVGWVMQGTDDADNLTIPALEDALAKGLEATLPTRKKLAAREARTP